VLAAPLVTGETFLELRYRTAAPAPRSVPVR
jgi:hypothetical protein